MSTLRALHCTALRVHRWRTDAKGGGELPRGLVELGAEVGLRRSVAERKREEGAQAHALGQHLPEQGHTAHSHRGADGGEGSSNTVGMEGISIHQKHEPQYRTCTAKVL